MQAHKMLSSIREVAQAGMSRMFNVTVGELTDYDPKTHSGRFTLPLFHDANGPIETGRIPIATPYAGPGEGAVFPAATGSQALIIFLDGQGMMPLGALLLFNNVDNPPFTDGKTYGWQDPNGTYVKTTNDAKGHGVRLGGKDYGSVVASKVELGAEGLSNSNALVRQSDLLAVVNVLNAFINIYNSHTHSGNGVPPTQLENSTANANASTVVFGE